MYVWTKIAETKAKQLGMEERKAGTIARLGQHELFGPIAADMEKRGYVEWRDEDEIRKG